MNSTWSKIIVNDYVEPLYLNEIHIFPNFSLLTLTSCYCCYC